MTLNPFTPPALGKIIDEQLYEARRLALEHEAAAEHHDALAMMYRARIDRLVAVEKVVPA